MRAPPANGRRSAERYVAVWLVCFGLLPESCRSRLPTAPVWAASRALSAGSPAESNNPASCARSRGPVQTPVLPHADFYPVVTENSVRSENTGVRIIREIMVATTMSSLFVALFALLASSFRTRAALQAEILALRHQLAVFQKNAPRRLRIHRCDRLLWVVLYRFWSGWRRCLEMVQPDTVLRWHRRAFAWHWTRKSRRLPGRPEVAANIRDLIQRMSQANPLWGAPRIHGELLKLGIAVAQSTVAKYLPRSRKPPSQTWRAFLTNHLAQTAAIDFVTVPTATFRVLFVFVVLAHERRRVVHFGVTEHPTQEWTMQQMRGAFPWDQAPRYVLRDRDAIYGR